MGGNPIEADDSLDPGLHPRGLQQDSDISGSDVESLAVTAEPGSENGEGNAKSVRLTKPTLEKYGFLPKAY